MFPKAKPSSQLVDKNWYLESISSTFYSSIFCAKFWHQKLQSCVLGLKFFGTINISTKCAHKMLKKYDTRCPFYQHLGATFCPNIFLPKNYKAKTISREKLHKTLVACKLLTKLTPRVHFTSIFAWIFLENKVWWNQPLGSIQSAFYE